MSLRGRPEARGGTGSRGRSVTGAWAGREAGLVVGREAEVGVLHELLVAGRSVSSAVVLDGEAGIGKTTLFDAALAAAREEGFAVFWCRPAEAEAAFSFAALGDLLRPALSAGLARLPSPQRRALAALLLEEVAGAAPEQRAIALAVFQLLGEHGAGPLLMAVDDVQWLDAASASVLAFALRRLAAAPVVVLHAYRDAPIGVLDIVVRVADDAIVVTVCDAGRGVRPRLDSPGLRAGAVLDGSPRGRDGRAGAPARY